MVAGEVGVEDGAVQEHVGVVDALYDDLLGDDSLGAHCCIII